MNQDAVKELLQKLHESPTEYNVIFSGKKSRKVNGLYKWGTDKTPEIIIHNRNFADDAGNQNENLLMFTAIHELTHHILVTENGKKSARGAHSQLFWATFHDLVDKAETTGVYRPEIDADTQKVIEEAREISKQIAELQRQLGQVLIRAHEVCKAKGLRYEDVMERRAQISQSTMKSSVAAYNMGDQNIGADIQAEAVKQRDEDKRDAIIAAGHEGKSVAQAKKAATPPRPRSE
ncbi:MAG: hypothetical protein LBK73_11940 [Treponema sp.]|jgi:hypothetical protein|nr:hypothetical protein [Treponema sp.]